MSLAYMVAAMDSYHQVEEVRGENDGILSDPEVNGGSEGGKRSTGIQSCKDLRSCDCG